MIRTAHRGKVKRDALLANMDELRQCLQIIISNAGNIADGTYGQTRLAAKTIEEIVKRAEKVVSKLERTGR